MITYPSVAPSGCYVYLFTVNGVPRYIGKGTRDRYKQHEKVKDKKTLPMWQNFLRKAILENANITVTIVADGLANDEALALEVAEIARYGRKANGTGPLMNFGPGGNGHDSETMKKIMQSSELRDAIRTRMLALHADPEYKAAHSEKMRAMHQDPDKKQRHLNAVRENASKQEYREKISQASKRAFAKQEVREAHRAGVIAAINTPEYKDTMRQRTKARWEDPEYREVMVALSRERAKDPSYRKEQSDRMKAVYATPEMRKFASERAQKFCTSPEHRQKMSEAVSKARRLKSDAAKFFGMKFLDATKEVVQAYLRMSCVND